MDNEEKNNQVMNQEVQVPIENHNSDTPLVPVTQNENKEENPVKNVIPTEGENISLQKQDTSVSQTDLELPKQVKKEMFNNAEQVIYNVTKQKEGNPIVVVLFMLALCAFVFFLPKIQEFTSKTQKPNNVTPIVTPSPSLEEEDKYLNFHEKGYIGDLEITNLVTTYINGNYELNYTIINNGSVTYTFNKKYYVVLYDGDKLIYRALIHSYTPLASKSSIELSLIINENAYNQANSFQLQEIQTSMYPSVTLTKEEEDFKILTCSYRSNTIQYYFKNNTLYKINDDISMNNIDNINYEQEKRNYQLLSESYKSIEGMQSTFIENYEDFRLINEFNLGDIQDNQLSNLKVYRYFKFRENVNVVAFEMETIGYTCS